MRLSDFTFTFHFHALEKEMATHSSVLAWRIPGTGESGGLLSMGLHRVGHDWCDLAAAAAAATLTYLSECSSNIASSKRLSLKSSGRVSSATLCAGLFFAWPFWHSLYHSPSILCPGRRTSFDNINQVFFFFWLTGGLNNVRPWKKLRRQKRVRL